jgi:teichuronic acid biosynthesis glycosyltransferase TuaH
MVREITMKESGMNPSFQRSKRAVAGNYSIGPDDKENIPENGTDLLNRKIEDLEKQIAILESTVQNHIDENDELTKLLTQRENSLSWKMGQTFGRFFPWDSDLTKALSKFLTTISKRSITHDRGKGKKNELRTELAQIVQDNKDNCRGIIVVPPTIDWNLPLFQRPQQLALALSDLGYLNFFSTAWNRFDNVHGFQKISNRCYLTDQYPLLVEELPRFFCIFPSPNCTLTFTEIRKLQNNSILLYDYIDEISEKISLGHSIDSLQHRHEYMLRTSDVILTTADILYTEAYKKRGRDVFFIPNAANYRHFHIGRKTSTLPSDIGPVIEKGHPVIGYFGALSSWFDYDLVMKLARERPGYEIVLIGWDFDGTLRNQGLKNYSNIHYLGAKEYSLLPSYAIWFDVSIIPFVKSTLTQATSPVKLFEYMALGNPIVTTEMAECMKYSSVFIGREYDEFIRKTDLALKYRQDKDYLALLDKEARENTWTARAAAIDTIISSLDRNRSGPVTSGTPQKPGAEPGL